MAKCANAPSAPVHSRVCASAPHTDLTLLASLSARFRTDSRGFPLGLLNEGPRDSQGGVKKSLIMIQGLLF